MDDSDHLCPLCCEEKDISDQQFYPCKCGYQVCMWCWHRIRESESGLCPACRTPYSDDPHAFSAVDVEKVLKANKEKAAAEKQKKEDVDRTLLANMRVIRRNLVYAVGLPPFNEDVLRKPEYFGQYGKISKIVINRNMTGVRASASAYVTFVHKEDTLACILALDGHTMDGRNVRASYGTSKYCSAFIKNVRCNNPECTYLHSMGEQEDTFTKQEIQAGYVTSGRDVLARQQQIMAQALSGLSGPRRKVGGGGPSGTGKSSANPIFPPPTYDEPPKAPTSSGITRSSSVPGYSSGPSPKIIRASSNVGSPMVSSTINSTAAAAAVVAASTGPSLTTIPKVPSASSAALKKASSTGTAAGPSPNPTAATVVARGQPVSSTAVASEQRTALTPLTKRTQKSKSVGSVNGLIGDGAPKVPSLRSNSITGSSGTNVPNITPKPIGTIGSLNSTPSHSPKLKSAAPLLSAGSLTPIGGAVIGGAPISGLGGQSSAATSSLGQSLLEGLGGLGGDIYSGGNSIQNNSDPTKNQLLRAGGASSIGGTPIGTSLYGGDRGGRIGGSVIGGTTIVGTGIGGGTIGGAPNGGGFGAIGSGIGPSGHYQSQQVRHSSNSQSSALASILGINLPTGSGSLSESSSMGSSLWPPRSHTPTHQLGSSSLLNHSNGSSHSNGHPSGAIGPIGSNVIGGAVSNTNGGRVIGSHKNGGGMGSGALNMAGGGKGMGSPIGGMTIGGSHTVRSHASSGSTKSDIAILQSLLPGVHITSGQQQQTMKPTPSGGDGFGWNGANAPRQSHQQQAPHRPGNSWTLEDNNKQQSNIW